MTNRQEVIEKALRRGADLSVKDQAAMVVQYLEIAEDLDATPTQTFMGMKVFTSEAMPKDKVAIVGMVENIGLEEPPALPSRLSAKPTEVTGLMRKYRTVDEIRAHLELNAPATMAVAIEGGDVPMELIRRIEAQEPMEQVKMSYIPKGFAAGIPVIFSVTDERYELAEKLQQVRDAVKTRFSAKPRVVQARSPRVMQPGADMVGGECSDADGKSAHW